MNRFGRPRRAALKPNLSCIKTKLFHEQIKIFAVYFYNRRKTEESHLGAIDLIKNFAMAHRDTFDSHDTV